MEKKFKVESSELMLAVLDEHQREFIRVAEITSELALQIEPECLKSSNVIGLILVTVLSDCFRHCSDSLKNTEKR